jgi:exodeoxyribonuclease V beta subunit
MNEPIFNILDPSEEIKRRLFLEASAGTGKTFTIEHYIVRLIVEKKLNIDEILVVTFTNKATQELYERIEGLLSDARQALFMAEQNSLEGLESFPYLRKLSDFTESRRHLEKSLRQFQKAAISTLHGFAHSALKKCDLISMISNRETSPRDFISEIISLECCSGRFNPFHIQKLKRRYPTAEELFLEVERAASIGASSIKMPYYNELIDTLKGRLSLLQKPREIDELYDDLTQLGSAFKSILSREKKVKPIFDFPLQELYEKTQNGSWTPAKVSEFVAAFEPVVRALSKENEKKKKASCEPTKHSLILSYAEAFEGLEVFLFEPDFTLHMLGSALKKKQREIGYLHSPDDYLYRLEELAQDPKKMLQLKAHITSNFKAVIIDEFQDTDPAQWTIFSRLFFFDNSFNYGLVVGDPKQSIYGFRKADIYTFFSAKATFEKDSCYRLSTNYRSSQRLTEILNRLFSMRHDRTFLWLPKLNQSIPFTPSLSPPEKNAELGQCPVQCFISDKLPDLKTQEKVIFPWVYREVIKLIEEGMQLHEISILVSDRFQMQSVESFLSERGIALQCHRDLPLKERSDWLKLKKMLGALYSENAETQIQAALFIEQSDANLFTKDFKTEVTKAFRKARIDFNSGGLLRALLEFELSHWIDSSLLNLAEEFETFRSENRFLAWDISSAIQAFERDYTDEVEAKQKHLQIMTIHKSKGLEFAAVFALGLVQPSRGLSRAFDVNGKIQLQVLASEREISAQEDELDAEKLRAFYVCTTRAKKRLFIPFMTKERIQPGKMSMNRAFLSRAFEGKEIQAEVLGKALCGAGAEVIYEEHFEPNEGLASFKMTDELTRSAWINYQLSFDPSWMQKTFELEKAAISYSSLHQQKAGNETLLLESVPIDEPKGPEIGTQLHEVLRVIFERGWHTRFGEDIFNRAARGVIPKSQLKLHYRHFYTWVKKALQTPIPEIGPLCEVEWENLAVEQPFYLDMDGNSANKIQGVIDLVVHHEGKIYIIDWKSNALGGYSPKDLEHAMFAHGYYLQASFYRYAAMQIIWPWKEAAFSKAVYFFVRGDMPVIFEPDPLEASALQAGYREGAVCL